MYYYKQIDENGEITSVMSCDTYLRESEIQKQISQEEYEEHLASFPEPEPLPEPSGYTITEGEIDAAYQEGVQSA